MILFEFIKQFNWSWTSRLCVYCFIYILRMKLLVIFDTVSGRDFTHLSRVLWNILSPRCIELTWLSWTTIRWYVSATVCWLWSCLRLPCLIHTAIMSEFHSLPSSPFDVKIYAYYCDCYCNGGWRPACWHLSPLNWLNDATLVRTKRV